MLSSDFVRGETGTPQHELLASMSLWTTHFPTQFALVGSFKMSPKCHCGKQGRLLKQPVPECGGDAKTPGLTRKS